MAASNEQAERARYGKVVEGTEGELSDEALEKVAGGTQDMALGQLPNEGGDIIGPVLPDPPG
jgi:hypothetical protein